MILFESQRGRKPEFWSVILGKIEEVVRNMSPRWFYK